MEEVQEVAIQASSEFQAQLHVKKLKEAARQRSWTITSDDDRLLDEVDNATPTGQSEPPAQPTPIADTLIFTDEETGPQLEVHESAESSGLEVEISDTEAA